MYTVNTMTNINKNSDLVNKKTTKSLKKAYFSSDTTTIKRKKIRLKNPELIALDKEYAMTRSFQAIALSLLSLYYSREDDKKSIYIKGVSIGKLAKFSGCSVRTVDAFFKTGFVSIKSGKKNYQTNLIKLEKKLFEYFDKLSTFLEDNFVDYIEIRHPNLRSNLTKVKYYINYNKSNDKNIENEVKKSVCESLNISQKTFEFYLERFDIKKTGRRIYLSYLECFIRYLKEGIRKGYIKTIAWFKEKAREAKGLFKAKPKERRRGGGFMALFGATDKPAKVKTPEQVIQEHLDDEADRKIADILGITLEEFRKAYPRK